MLIGLKSTLRYNKSANFSLEYQSSTSASEIKTNICLVMTLGKDFKKFIVEKGP